MYFLPTYSLASVIFINSKSFSYVGAPVTMLTLGYLPLSIILPLLLVCRASAHGIFELKIEEFRNEFGTDVNGLCCQDLKAGNYTRCSGQCQTFFRVCATHTSLSGVKDKPTITTESQNASFITKEILDQGDEHKTARFNIDFPCTIGMTVTNIEAGNVYVKKSNSPLQFYYRYPFPWPGDVSIIVEAWHKTDRDGQFKTDMGEKGKLLVRFATNKNLSPGSYYNSKWVTETLEVQNKSLTFDVRVKCDKKYYGSNCSEYCSAYDDPGKFTCSKDGKKVCKDGWTGDSCDKPICAVGCHPKHGYCRRAGECRCRLGWKGKKCDECVLLPGCFHGTCHSPFECNCKNGWDGLFCNHPTCKDGCHPTRGYCSSPGDCNCRIGWGGKNCYNCTTIPGCINGFCKKPLDCICKDGWNGIFCNNPVCKKGCDSLHGYCEKPGKCRCRVGWRGENCTECYPYPGCDHGFCNLPWECQCEYGWGGFTCNEKLNYCDKTNPCKNDSQCVSKSKDDGNYLCVCLGKYTGRNCDELIEDK